MNLAGNSMDDGDWRAWRIDLPLCCKRNCRRGAHVQPLPF